MVSKIHVSARDQRVVERQSALFRDDWLSVGRHPIRESLASNQL
jgi:hypothetical protein